MILFEFFSKPDYHPSQTLFTHLYSSSSHFSSFYFIIDRVMIADTYLRGPSSSSTQFSQQPLPTSWAGRAGAPQGSSWIMGPLKHPRSLQKGISSPGSHTQALGFKNHQWVYPKPCYTQYKAISSMANINYYIFTCYEKEHFFSATRL